MLHRFAKTKANSRRRGAATVEFALTAPILFMMIMAGFEFSRANMLINTTKLAAAEGARKGIIVGTTANDVEQVVMDELSVVGVKYAEVMVYPEVVTDDTEAITVGVLVPLDIRNSYVVPSFFLGDFVWKVTAVPREAKSSSVMDEMLAADMTMMTEQIMDRGQALGNGNGNGNAGGNGNGNAGGNGNGNAGGNGNGNAGGNGNGNAGGNGNGNAGGNGNGNAYGTL